MPPTATLPALPTFTPSLTAPSGLELLAAAASSAPTVAKSTPLIPAGNLSTPGPYNPTAALPQRVVKKILDLEFVEMADLTTDAWQDDMASDPPNLTRCPTRRAPITDIFTWLDCYSRMAPILATRFPEKASELWAYQATILRAAKNYEGTAWVAYDRQFRCESLARKDLNWSVPDPRLYNEAFTGRAKSIPRCPYCLSENHAGLYCPVNPNPPLVGWLPEARHLQPSMAFPQANRGSVARQEVCWNYNDNQCRYNKCRYLHLCKECFGPHPAIACPRNPTSQLARGTGRRQSPVNQPRLGPAQLPGPIGPR